MDSGFYPLGFCTNGAAKVIPEKEVLYPGVTSMQNVSGQEVKGDKFLSWIHQKNRQFICEYDDRPIKTNSDAEKGNSHPSGPSTRSPSNPASADWPSTRPEGSREDLVTDPVLPNVDLTGPPSRTDDHVRQQNEDFEAAPGDSETVGAVNEHTSGTEFYGKSSNFVLLSQLFSQARKQLSKGTASSPDGGRLRQSFSAQDAGAPQTYSTPPQDRRSGSLSQDGSPITASGTQFGSRDSNETPLSIVNILYDESSNLPDPNPTAPLTVAGRAQTSDVSGHGSRKSYHTSPPQFRRPSKHKGETTLPTAKRVSQQPSSSVNISKPAVYDPNSAAAVSDSSVCFFGSPMVLEMEYVGLFFQNIHYIQPCLSYDDFKARCEQEIWASRSLRRLRRQQMHFLALYNAVLAVGALTAGTDMLYSYREELDAKMNNGHLDVPKKAVSSIRLSKLYFQRAKRLLGDVFEVCSLESAQTLLLMSIYCQHALKPHACYMYSGMAVRTALAIGLPNDSTSRSEAARLVARKTWWSIYSQEIETSCSSGRSSSLMDTFEYQISFPSLKETPALDASNEERQILIIPEQVRLSVILQRASKEIYHSSKVLSLEEKSQIALELEENLDNWKSALPPWLDWESTVFKEPEWASKQKLSLQLRFYHAKMFLHRPFFGTTTDEVNLSFVRHVNACLFAARKIISILYEAYAHRYYFRTWWYNSTYALSASVIILSLILLDCTNIPLSDLVVDIQKALNVLDAMEDMAVAQRSAELIREILEVAQSYVSGRFYNSKADDANLGDGNSTSTPWIAQARDIRSPPPGHNSELAETIFMQNFTIGTEATMDDLLASLMDPNMIEGFATVVEDNKPIDFGGPPSEFGWASGFDFDMNYEANQQGNEESHN